MKIVSYLSDGRRGLGVRTEDGIVATGFSDLREYLAGGPGAQERLERAVYGATETVDPDRLLAPIPERSALICVGGNYQDHLEEVDLHPSEPVYFPKLWSALLDPGDVLHPPDADTLLDYEVEFAVVIGRQARGIRAADALDYVFGYTVVNDMSARDVMAREPMQIMLCKSADGLLPIAPEIVTRDEVPVADNAITCMVNDEVRQSSTLDQMLYPVPYLLEFLTRYVTLSPGDLVTTGTPGGVALGRSPSAFLRPGDVVTCSVAGVATVATTIGEPR
jgi:2-keto-4-pentenoate hydratase/2-oxohepta-3-ene-1,7-dioic acid hydratase in catechol pathway